MRRSCVGASGGGAGGFGGRRVAEIAAVVLAGNALEEGPGEVEGLIQGIGGKAAAEVVEQARPAQDVAYLRTAADENHGHAVGMAAFDELFEGVGSRGVEPEHAGKVKNEDARRRFLHGMQAAFQLVNGPEKERAFNNVDGEPGGHVPRHSIEITKTISYLEERQWQRFLILQKN